MPGADAAASPARIVKPISEKIFMMFVLFPACIAPTCVL